MPNDPHAPCARAMHVAWTDLRIIARQPTITVDDCTALVIAANTYRLAVQEWHESTEESDTP